MAAMSAVARLLVYIITCSAVPVLRQRQCDTRGENIFQLPGGRVIPLLAVVSSAAVILAADLVSLLAGGVALLLGTGIYFYRRLVFAGKKKSPD